MVNVRNAYIITSFFLCDFIGIDNGFESVYAWVWYSWVIVHLWGLLVGVSCQPQDVALEKDRIAASLFNIESSH